jgi:hypothetical protein
MDKRDENSTDEIEITPAMIEAAASVLWAYDSIEIGLSLATALAHEMLERALKARRDEKRAGLRGARRRRPSVC